MCYVLLMNYLYQILISEQLSRETPAIETSTIIDSDATVFNEEEHRTLMKERRRKHARVRVSSAEQSVSDETEPPSKKHKKQKKQKNEFPNIPSQLDSEEGIFILLIHYLLR